MLPSQASVPLRRVLQSCLRLYQQHSASSSAGIIKSETWKPSSGFVSANTAVFTSGVQEKSSCLGNNCIHPRTFSTSCTLCDAVEKQAEDAEKKSMKFENGEKVQELHNASFEKLMKMAPKVETPFLACLILQRLCSLHKEGETQSASSGESLLQDPRLSKALKMIDENITMVTPKVILNTLQELYDVTSSDVYVVKSLVTQVLWLTRRLPMAMLMQVLQVHMSHQETSLRKSVVQQTMTVLERRWVELTSPKDIIFLMYTTQNGSIVNQTLMERLEDRALDIVEKATPKELYRIIYILSRQRHRNTPLIRAVVYHLNKNTLSTLSAVQLANLTYAMCTLNVYDSSILSKISAELVNKKEHLTPKLASSMMASFSRLRWKETSVMQMLLNILDENLRISEDTTQKSRSFLNAADKAGLVLSLANLNLDATESRALVEKIVKSPDVQGLRETSPLLWLDVVWSLSVLQMLDAASVSSVLAEDFWGKLPSSDSFQSLVNLTKVNNINCAARYELEGYTGPFLPSTISTGDAKSLQRGERKMTEKVIAALTNMAPAETYSKINTTAFGGYLVDAEFYVDSTGNPKPLSQASQSPADCHRVALKVLDFPDLTLPTSDLTGLNAMTVRHLCHQGYTVILVKHSEVSSKTKVVELVQFLQQKVKDTLKVTPPSQSDS